MTQHEALDILKLGKNVYLTGSAGSGKTYLLNQYIKYLKDNDVDVAVTASTGVAATHMNGMTIHSWSGLGIRDELSDQDMDEMEEKHYLWNRFQNVKVLIIDEVSMLHHFRLDLVERIVRSFKRNNQVFGGLQVVLCGDFFQLPPVSRMGEREAHFIYESQTWKALGLTVCYLHEQHRQTDDACLDVLNAIRTNDISEDTYEHLKSRFNKVPDTSIEPTRLYTHNIDVDSINERELKTIDGGSTVYTMTTEGRPALVETLKKSCLAPEKLNLKKGARVMFVKNNFEMGYVNGTLGKIVGLAPAGPIVETIKGVRITAIPADWTIEEDGKVKAQISQVPLRLAWAITVHKSQGMSLDAVEVDLSKSFEPGMGYVALSRVRTLAGLNLLGINDMALRVHGEVLEFDKHLQELSETAADKLKDMSPARKAAQQKEFLDSIKSEFEEKKIPTHEKTLLLIQEKMSLKDMAKNREVGVGTIIDHLERLAAEGKINPDQDLAYIKKTIKRLAAMQKAFGAVYKETGN